MEEGLALVVERKGKKRKRNKMREDRVRPFCQGPLDVLGRDLMLRVLNSLDARSLALCLVVSRTWNRVASSDLIWTSKVSFFIPFSFLIDVCYDTGWWDWLWFNYLRDFGVLAMSLINLFLGVCLLLILLQGIVLFLLFNFDSKGWMLNQQVNSLG